MDLNKIEKRNELSLTPNFNNDRIDFTVIIDYLGGTHERLGTHI